MFIYAIVGAGCSVAGFVIGVIVTQGRMESEVTSAREAADMMREEREIMRRLLVSTEEGRAAILKGGRP
jgi:hypothetical protein